MSYWIGVDYRACPTCLRTPDADDHFNYTSNVEGMWDLAMPDLHLRDMNGKDPSVCIPHLRDGIRDMKEYPVTYRSLDPRNGWGNYEGALDCLVKLLAMCEQRPTGIVYVSQ